MGLSLAAVAPAHAGLDVIVPPTAEYLPPFSVPKLPAIPGWQSNLGLSLSRQARILFPAGKTPETAGAMVVAKAIPKEQAPGLRTLNDLVIQDHIEIRGRDPGAEISEIPAVTDKARRQIRVFAVRSGDRSVHHMKAFSEEKDAKGQAYWTIFSLVVQDRAELERGVEAFQDMLRAYR